MTLGRYQKASLLFQQNQLLNLNNTHLGRDCRAEDPLEWSVSVTELILATVALAQCSLMQLYELGNLVK